MAPRLNLKENESMIRTQRIKALLLLEARKLISFRIHQLTWLYTFAYGHILAHSRIELKEMENKPPMETIAEEDGQNEQKKDKLKDQSDKEEGVPGRSLISGYNLFLFTTCEPHHIA